MSRAFAWLFCWLYGVVCGGLWAFVREGLDSWKNRAQKLGHREDCIGSLWLAENVLAGLNTDLGLFLGGNGNHE